MGAVISMRGQLSAAVAIAVFNQLEEVNQLVGSASDAFLPLFPAPLLLYGKASLH